MKNRWVTFVTGRVLVKIEGTGLERLINICARKKVSLWSMRKMKTGAMFFISHFLIYIISGISSATLTVPFLLFAEREYRFFGSGC